MKPRSMSESMDGRAMNENMTERSPDDAPGFGGVVLLLAVVTGLVAVAVFFSLESPVDTNPSIHPAVGVAMPDLKLVALGEAGNAGETIRLADLGDCVTVVNFWATWCGPCRSELPHLGELQRHFADEEDFRLCSVVCESMPPDGPKALFRDARGLMNEANITAPLYTDPDNTTRAAFDRIGSFQGYPTTIVLDRQGVVRGVWVGFDRRMDKWLTSMVENLLAAKH